MSHLELSKWTGQSCISFYSKFLSISLLFYHVAVVVVVCDTTTYIYVVVVVVYYTTGTMTTTRFMEIDYDVFKVK